MCIVHLKQKLNKNFDELKPLFSVKAIAKTSFQQVNFFAAKQTNFNVSFF